VPVFPMTELPVLPDPAVSEDEVSEDDVSEDDDVCEDVEPEVAEFALDDVTTVSLPLIAVLVLVPVDWDVTEAEEDV